MPETDPLNGTRRVMVYGVTGSGKTTAAAQIARATGLPWHSVDELTWEPGWVPVPGEEQRRRIAAICAEPVWILDTAYGQWIDIPLARVELIVALDYPRWFSLRRLVRRTAARVIDKKQICNGNTERLRDVFARDSILLWHFRSFKRKRQRIRQWMADPDGPTVLRFSKAAEAERWIAGLSTVPN